MRQEVCLFLSLIITGSGAVSWDMVVSPEVVVSRGQDAVLRCSFTHPRQRHYSGDITVKWLSRDGSARPFFSCSLRNDSAANGCSASGLRHSLGGDPRRGELTLLIRRVHVADSGAYFCRVELDMPRDSFQKETRLNVTAAPQILSLSVVESSFSSERLLQCEVEGHPLPAITWRSSSGRVPADQVQTAQVGPDRLLSSVPYREGAVFTCQAESMLGRAAWTFPHNKGLIIGLTLGGAILLLLTAGLICYKRCRDKRPLQDSDSPAEGDVELQPVYCDITVNTQRAAITSPAHRQEDTGVVYAQVNVGHH